MIDWDTKKIDWYVLCPKCKTEYHLADLGYEVVTLGQRINLTCPKCGKKIEKVIGISGG